MHFDAWLLNHTGGTALAACCVVMDLIVRNICGNSHPRSGFCRHFTCSALHTRYSFKHYGRSKCNTELTSFSKLDTEFLDSCQSDCLKGKGKDGLLAATSHSRYPLMEAHCGDIHRLSCTELLLCWSRELSLSLTCIEAILDRNLVFVIASSVEDGTESCSLLEEP